MKSNPVKNVSMYRKLKITSNQLDFNVQLLSKKSMFFDEKHFQIPNIKIHLCQKNLILSNFPMENRVK